MATSIALARWRTALAVRTGAAASAVSRRLGAGSGGMIGGTVAARIDPQILDHLAEGRVVVLVTGTNGKSTTTRMVRAGLDTLTAPEGAVASNIGGDNMEGGVVQALIDTPAASHAALEVDEMHLPRIAAATHPAVLVLLNLSRDQLDRVGEITAVEARLRQAVEENPEAVVVANCDDPLIASAAWDARRVVWVAAGSGWTNDSVSFPRGGGLVVRQGDTWSVVGSDTYRRPTPDWTLETAVDGHGGEWPLVVAHRGEGQAPVRALLNLALPGRANLGNAAQAIAAVCALGGDLATVARAVRGVREVAGRYLRVNIDGRSVHLMLAKNPAGWQEALSMINPAAPSVVVAVNGQVPDGEDLSWLWDVGFEALREGRHTTTVATGERGADLAVRLDYADVPAVSAPTVMEAIHLCPPGPVELLANYTAFRDFRRILVKRGDIDE